MRKDGSGLVRETFNGRLNSKFKGMFAYMRNEKNVKMCCRPDLWVRGTQFPIPSFDSGNVSRTDGVQHRSERWECNNHRSGR
jgi:hypothetical protein